MKKYCEICERRIFFNKNQNICKKCRKKTSNNFMSISIENLKYLVQDYNLKRKIKKEESFYSFKKRVKLKNKNNFNGINLNYVNKISKYIFKQITFKRCSSNKLNLSNIEIIIDNNIIKIKNKNDIIAELYKGTLNEYLKFILNNSMFEIEIVHLNHNEKYIRFSIIIYKLLSVEDLQNLSIIKTNAVKTQNNKKEKRQEYISKLKNNDIVFIINDKTKLLIKNEENETLGEIPNNLKAKLKNKKNIKYVGVIEQIYRCYNGLKTFDIKIIPIEL